MELLNFIFQLGVLFAIYGFLWGIMEIGIRLLSAGRKRSLGEVYLIKAIKYFFLANVTFLFCKTGANTKLIVINQGIIAGVVLLTYFIGKLQQKKNQSRIFKMGITGIPGLTPNFNLRAEILVITIALMIFAGFWIYPIYAANPLANWFHASIKDISDTPVFGFVFKVIGFFFMLNMIVKVVNAFNYLLSGARSNNSSEQDFNSNGDDQFDDYEEIN